MDQYFSRMRTFANNPDMPARIRFMLQDVLELRHSVVSSTRILIHTYSTSVLKNLLKIKGF